VTGGCVGHNEVVGCAVVDCNVCDIVHIHPHPEILEANARSLLFLTCLE
jgi:hypothetical protein